VRRYRDVFILKGKWKRDNHYGVNGDNVFFELLKNMVVKYIMILMKI